MNELVNNQEKNQGNEKRQPRKKTLDFLTHFARVYHAEPDMQQEICGYVMN